MSTETIRLIRDGEKGGSGVWRWGKSEIIYLPLPCHYQNDSCIKMGSDESHFNVSVGSDGQSHKTVSTNHNLFWRERRAEAVSNQGPSTYQPNALPLGQTGSWLSFQSNSRVVPTLQDSWKSGPHLWVSLLSIQFSSCFGLTGIILVAGSTHKVKEETYSDHWTCVSL